MLDHEGARAVAFELVVEAEEMGTQGSVQVAVGNLDRLDGLSLGRERRPQIEHREEVPGRRRKCERPGIFGSAPFRTSWLGIDQSDAETLRREFGQRKRKRSPHEPAAGDHHVEPIPASCLSFRHLPAMPRSAWRVNLLKGGRLLSERLRS